MRGIARSAERVLLRISAAGGWVGKVVLVVIVLAVVVNVALRYIFNQPVASIVEVVELSMVIVVFFSIVVCTALQGHLEVDVLVMRLSQRTQAIIGIIGRFIGAGLFSVIARQSIIRAIYLSQIGGESVMLELPYYPFWLLITLCSVLISLLLLAQIAYLIIEAMRR